VAIEELVHKLGRDKVVAIRYGAWGSDNYNINNPTENNARVAYYGMGTGTPRAWVDGLHHMVGSGQIPAEVEMHTNNRLPIPSPYEIDISGDLSSQSVIVKVKATDSPPSGNKYLRIAVIEKEYDWPVAPGTNGQTHFENSLLDMVPDAQGTLLNIAVGDSQTFTFTYNQNQVNFHPPSSLDALLSVVAFVQNDVNKEVMQAFYGDVGIDEGSFNASALIQSAGSSTLEGYLFNNSEGSISIDLGLSGQIPPGWNVTASSVQGTIPINGGSLTVNLAAYDSLIYGILVDPQGNSGGITLDANISLTSNPTLSTVTKYYVTTNDVDGLIVDASIEGYGSVLQNSLENVFTGTHGFINRDALQGLSISLDNIDMILWSAGNNPKAFYPDEVSALQNFLDNGGNLFITGQDIGDDIFGTSASSQHAQSFYNNYLHANFQSDFSTWLYIKGFDGDPITNGIEFPVSPTIYERNTDVISPFDAQATSILKYFDGPDVCGIRALTSNYHVVYISMGFEQINDPVDRDSIMARSIRWFEESTSGIEGDDLQPLLFELAQNYPNPFNPETVIKYSLDNYKAEQTTLVIYNALGQVVRHLVDEPQSAGYYEVSWNARDNFGNPVASGIYYYQLKSAQNSTVQKMVLVR
jgi:hypothetical protein